MKKIAIIKVRDLYNHYEDHEKIIDKITDFEEVSDEQFEKLTKAQWEFGFTIIEQPVNLGSFIANTVSEYDTLIEKRAEEKRRADEVSRKKNEAAKLKKQLAIRDSNAKALKKLIDSQVLSGMLTQEEADIILARNK